MNKKVERKSRGVLAEAVEALQVTAEILEDVKEGIFFMAVELDKLNEQLADFFKDIKEKGIITRAR